MLQTVLEQGGHFAGINRKVQLKPTQWAEEGPDKEITEATLSLKHGGVLTHAGRQQVSFLFSSPQASEPQSDFSRVYGHCYLAALASVHI